ncbi:helix-turn-helix domain-containing protein [Brevibacterium linens]|uniref:helix-turn-helix domain-containing protein n=1 Tax=Brevibacterium linens TaxID=1703 RepID=UPI00124AFF85|nr:helix-turn-helix transcriptional regulator [Brevibacterium linens]KAB1947654.1 helix-turn-helix transcriptional regulator [Brevibacterium linens ATCC 9172]
MESIGANVKRLRRQRGLTQTQLAEQLLAQPMGWQWSQMSISRLENGNDITVSQLEALAAVLGREVLANTRIGTFMSDDFAYLQQQSRLHELSERAHKALADAKATTASLQAIVDQVGDGHGEHTEAT